MAGDSLGEDRAFFKFQAHIQAHQHQRRTEQERNTPAPFTELLVAERQGQGQEQAVGGQKADRRAQLGEHAEPGALAFGGVLGGQQRRATPFTAQAQALAKAQQAQDDRRPHANAVIARQYADGGGGDTHQQQRGNQGRFAADTVAKVAEQRRTQRASEEGDAEGEEGCQHLRGARPGWEEYRADHQGSSSGVHVEVVELDGGADEAGSGYPRGRVDRRGRRFGVGAACH